MKRVLRILLPSAGMLILILWPQRAVSSAADAVLLCLRTVVPSLFPFFVLSGLLSGALIGIRNRSAACLGRLCRMQPGTESILVIGLLGGYPTGAQITAQAWRDGHLSQDQARMMLGFCSNAGPAFLFGICGSLFSNPCMPWLLWGIHIASAVLTARSLPDAPSNGDILPSAAGLSLPEALDRALKNIARVCGWVVLFRILMDLLGRWLTDLPETLSVIVSGVLELTNGCMMLENVGPLWLRFYLCSLFLAFGGICVTLQTVSVAGELGIRYYLRGKLLQTALTGIFSLVILLIFFPSDCKPANYMVISLLVVHIFAYILLKSKKTVAFRRALLYNHKKQESWT